MEGGDLAVKITIMRDDDCSSCDEIEENIVRVVQREIVDNHRGGVKIIVKRTNTIVVPPQ